MSHGRGKVGVPVLNEGIRVETQYFNPIFQTPLPRGAAAQVEPDLRYRQGSHLQIKHTGSFPYRPILELVQYGKCHGSVIRSVSCIFWQFLLH